jgi:hypothetical protein
VSAADGVVRDAPHQSPPQPTVSPAAHNDQPAPVSSARCRIAPALRSGTTLTWAPATLPPTSSIFLTCSLSICLALCWRFSASSRNSVGKVKSAAARDSDAVQLRVSLISQVNCGRCGKLGASRTVGGRQDLRWKMLTSCASWSFLFYSNCPLDITSMQNVESDEIASPPQPRNVEVGHLGEDVVPPPLFTSVNIRKMDNCQIPFCLRQSIS